MILYCRLVIPCPPELWARSAITSLSNNHAQNEAAAAAMKNDHPATFSTSIKNCADINTSQNDVMKIHEKRRSSPFSPTFYYPKSRVGGVPWPNPQIRQRVLMRFRLYKSRLIAPVVTFDVK